MISGTANTDALDSFFPWNPYQGPIAKDPPSNTQTMRPSKDRVSLTKTDFKLAAKSNESKGLDLKIVTKDGDLVTININNQSQTGFQETSKTSKASNQAKASYFSKTSENLSFSVQGNLDKDELDAIGGLINDVADLAAGFFSSGLQQTSGSASSLGFDESELAGFSLGMDHKTSYTMAGAWKSEISNGIERNLNPSGLTHGNAGNLGGKARKIAKSPALDIFDNPGKAMGKIITALKSRGGLSSLKAGNGRKEVDNNNNFLSLINDMIEQGNSGKAFKDIFQFSGMNSYI